MLLNTTKEGIRIEEILLRKLKPWCIATIFEENRRIFVRMSATKNVKFAKKILADAGIDNTKVY